MKTSISAVKRHPTPLAFCRPDSATRPPFHLTGIAVVLVGWTVDVHFAPPTAASASLLSIRDYGRADAERQGMGTVPVPPPLELDIAGEVGRDISDPVGSSNAGDHGVVEGSLHPGEGFDGRTYPAAAVAAGLVLSLEWTGRGGIFLDCEDSSCHSWR